MCIYWRAREDWGQKEERQADSILGAQSFHLSHRHMHDYCITITDVSQFVCLIRQNVGCITFALLLPIYIYCTVNKCRKCMLIRTQSFISFAASVHE